MPCASDGRPLFPTLTVAILLSTSLVHSDDSFCAGISRGSFNALSLCNIAYTQDRLSPEQRTRATMSAGRTIYEQYSFNPADRTRSQYKNMTSLIYSGIAVPYNLESMWKTGSFDAAYQPMMGARKINCAGPPNDVEFPNLFRGNLSWSATQPLCGGVGNWTQCVKDLLETYADPVTECRLDTYKGTDFPVCCLTQSNLNPDGPGPVEGPDATTVRNIYETYSYECPTIMMRACMCEDMDPCAFRVQGLQRDDMVDWKVYAAEMQKPAADRDASKYNLFQQQFPELYAATGGFGGSPLVPRVAADACDASDLSDCIVECVKGNRTEFLCHEIDMHATNVGLVCSDYAGVERDPSNCNARRRGDKNCNFYTTNGCREDPYPCLPNVSAPFTFEACSTQCTLRRSNCNGRIEWENMRGHDDPVPYRYHVLASTCPVNAGGGVPRADEAQNQMCNLDSFPYALNLNTSTGKSYDTYACTITCGQLKAAVLSKSLPEYFVNRLDPNVKKLENQSYPTKNWVASPNPPTPPPAPPSPPPPPRHPRDRTSAFCERLTPTGFAFLDEFIDLFRGCLCGDEFYECYFKYSQPNLVRGGPIVVTYAACPHAVPSRNFSIAQMPKCHACDVHSDPTVGCPPRSDGDAVTCAGWWYIPPSGETYEFPRSLDEGRGDAWANQDIPVVFPYYLWSYNDCEYLRGAANGSLPFDTPPPEVNSWNWSFACPTWSSRATGDGAKRPDKPWQLGFAMKNGQQEYPTCDVFEYSSEAKTWFGSSFATPFACMNRTVHAQISTAADPSAALDDYINSDDFGMNMLQYMIARYFQNEDCNILLSVEAFDDALARKGVWPYNETDFDWWKYNTPNPALCSAFPNVNWTDTSEGDFCTRANGTWYSWTKRVIGARRFMRLISSASTLQHLCIQNHVKVEGQAYCPPEFDIKTLQPINDSKSLFGPGVCLGDSTPQERSEFKLPQNFQRGAQKCDDVRVPIQDCFAQCNRNSTLMTESNSVTQFNDANIKQVTACAQACRDSWVYNFANPDHQNNPSIPVGSNWRCSPSPPTAPPDITDFARFQSSCNPGNVRNIYRNSTMAGSYCLGVLGSCGYHQRVEPNNTMGWGYEVKLEWRGAADKREIALYDIVQGLRSYLISRHEDETEWPTVLNLSAPVITVDFALDTDHFIPTTDILAEVQRLSKGDFDANVTIRTILRYLHGKPVASGGEVRYIFPEGQLSGGEADRENSLNCQLNANFYGSSQVDYPRQDPVWLAYLNQTTFAVTHDFPDNSCEACDEENKVEWQWQEDAVRRSCPFSARGQKKCPFSGIGKLCTPPHLAARLGMAGLDVRIGAFTDKNGDPVRGISGTFPIPPLNEDCVMRCSDIRKYFEYLLDVQEDESDTPPAPPGVPDGPEAEQFAVDVSCMSPVDGSVVATGAYASPHQLFKSSQMMAAEASLRGLMHGAFGTQPPTIHLATGSAPDDRRGSCSLMRVDDARATSFNQQYILFQSINTFATGEARSFDVQMAMGGSGIWSGTNHACDDATCACFNYYGSASDYIPGASWTTMPEQYSDCTSTPPGTRGSALCDAIKNSKGFEPISRKLNVRYVPVRCPTPLTDVTGFVWQDDDADATTIPGAVHLLEQGGGQEAFTTSMLDCKTPTMGYPQQTSLVSVDRRVVTSAISIAQNDHDVHLTADVQAIENTVGLSNAQPVGLWFALKDDYCPCIPSGGKKRCWRV